MTKFMRRYSRLVFLSRVGLGLLIVGGLFQLTASLYGSCSHYVFTQSEWNNHQRQQGQHSWLLNSQVLNTQFSNSLYEVMSGWTGEPIRQVPCHGPSCRNQQLPAPTLAPAPSRSEQPKQNGIAVVATATECMIDQPEYHVPSQLRVQGFLKQTFRPPRV